MPFKVRDNSLIIHKSASHLFSVLISNFKTRLFFSSNEENIRYDSERELPLPNTFHKGRFI